MTNPEIPEEAREAASAALVAHMREWHEDGSVACKACGFVDDKPYGWPKHQADIAITAALPHLRVQETPPWEGITSREPEGEALAQMRKWYADNGLPGPHHCPTWEDPDGCRCTAPHPRPVVDREALRAIVREMASWQEPVEYVDETTDRILALLAGACTCDTDADVTPDMRTETGQHLTGCPLALLPTEEGEGS